MKTVTYAFTGDTKIPAEVTKKGKTTPVWIQQLWEDGEYKEYVQKNGCGHCCAAMAANLHGVKITPHEEYEYCRKIWGAPKEPQQHFMSVTGVAKVLVSLDIKAAAYPILDRAEATAKITEALCDGKIVIFVSKPCEEYPENPFSKGSHWVLAAGYDAEGKIVVANSSNRAITADGIQCVTPQVIHDALYVGEQLEDRTWGILKPMTPGVGFVIVG